MIIKEALDIYKHPEHIASKAAIHACFDRNINPYSENGYSSEYQDIYSSLLPDAITDPNRLINDYKIEDFQASRSWLTSFMQKHKLVFRKAHKKKRGAIDPDSVQKYIQELRMLISVTDLIKF